MIPTFTKAPTSNMVIEPWTVQPQTGRVKIWAVFTAIASCLNCPIPLGKIDIPYHMQPATTSIAEWCFFTLGGSLLGVGSWQHPFPVEICLKNCLLHQGFFLETRSLCCKNIIIYTKYNRISYQFISYLYSQDCEKHIFTPLKFHQQNEGLTMPVDIMNIHSYIISVLNPFPPPFYPNPWQHADLRGRGLKQHLLLEPKLFDNRNHQQSFMIWAIYPERSKQWIGVWKPIQNYIPKLL